VAAVDLSIANLCAGGRRARIGRSILCGWTAICGLQESESFFAARQACELVLSMGADDGGDPGDGCGYYGVCTIRLWENRLMVAVGP
jgi:hypothetical protein